MEQGKDMDKAAGKEPDMDTELDTAQSLAREVKSRSGREKHHARQHAPFGKSKPSPRMRTLNKRYS